LLQRVETGAALARSTVVFRRSVDFLFFIAGALDDLALFLIFSDA
jgi:hypothetical protein